MEKDQHLLRRPGSVSDAPLPPERAFVVQLRRLDDPGAEVLVGRVEHIASGAAGRFASAAELTAFIARIGGADSPADPSSAASTEIARAVMAGEHGDGDAAGSGSSGGNETRTAAGNHEKYR